MSKTAIIIPARYHSTRLPAKPLIEVANKPVIQWVWEKACLSKLADEVIIATDNDEIYEKCRSFGASVEMTLETHRSGSDRIAEVVSRHPEFSYVINLQGDEPTIAPKNIDVVINLIKSDENADISTLLRVIKDESDINSQNIVKCVKDVNDFAMYFSRSKIPFERQIDENTVFYAHIGLYGYKKDALLKMTSLPPSSLEKAESLEQLRALQNGLRIKTAVVECDAIGIDTKEDLQKFKNLIEV